MSNLAAEGESVIIRMHDDHSSQMLKLDAGDQKIGKFRIKVGAIVGTPYGSVFEVANKELVMTSFSETTNMMEEIQDGTSVDNESSSSVVVDNRHYHDSNTAQKLNHDDIQKLRDEGSSGTNIIKTLISNSDTWASKSEFAQEKWLKRKAKKYVCRFRVVKCTPHTLCEVYYQKSPNKICGLRWDALAQILSHGGVYAGGKVLIFEHTMGLVTGAVAYRMQGMGAITVLFAGQQPHLELIERLNMSDHAIEIIETVGAAELGPAAAMVLARTTTQEECTGDVDQGDGDDGFLPPDKKRRMEDAQPEEAEGAQKVEAERLHPSSRNHTSRKYNASNRKPEEIKRLRQQLCGGYTSLIIASKYRPLPVLQQGLVLLLPSSPIVIYSEFMEPLVECYLYLQENSLAIRLVLADTWLREYQTLPGRVHPQMHMPTSGGFLLMGTYVGGNTLAEGDS